MLATPLLAGHLLGGRPVAVANAFGGQVIAGTEPLAAISGLFALTALAVTYAAIWRRRAALRAAPELVPLAALAVLLAADLQQAVLDDEGRIARSEVNRAMALYGIAPDKPDPAAVK